MNFVNRSQASGASSTSDGSLFDVARFESVGFFMSPPDEPPGQDTPPKDKEIERAIGSVCAAWAKLETTLTALLGLLLNADVTRGRIVYDSISTHRGRMELISRLVVTFVDDEELKEKWSRLYKRCKKFASKRNMIVHSWSVFFPHEDRIAFVKTIFPDARGRKFGTEYELLSIKTVLQLSESVRDLDVEILSLILYLRGHVRETPLECIELFDRHTQ